jgi:hypothetical protein
MQRVIVRMESFHRNADHAGAKSTQPVIVPTGSFRRDADRVGAKTTQRAIVRTSRSPPDLTKGSWHQRGGNN